MKSKQHGKFHIAAAMCVMMCCGIVYLWSAFQEPVIELLQWDPHDAIMISSSIVFIYLIGASIGGFVVSAMGAQKAILTGSLLYTAGLLLTSFLIGWGKPWMICISYGVITGTGVGFCYSGTINCIQGWMPERPGLASGLAVCSFGLSSMLLSPYIEWLLSRPAFGAGGIGMTFRVLALTVGLLMIAASLAAKGNPALKNDKADAPALTLQRQYRPKEALRQPEFWCIACSIFFTPAAYMIIVPLVKTIAFARGLSELQASLTLSLTGIVSAVSRLANSMASDRFGRTRVVCVLALMTMSASLLLIGASGWGYTITVLYLVFAYAGTSGVFPAMCTESFGARYAGANYGMLLFCIAFSSPFYTKVSELINRDGVYTGDYTLTFIMSACVCIVPLTAMPLYTYFRKKRLARENIG